MYIFSTMHSSPTRTESRTSCERNREQFEILHVYFFIIVPHTACSYESNETVFVRSILDRRKANCP